VPPSATACALTANQTIKALQIHRAEIDFTTAYAADPAGDLLPAWYIFDGQARRAFRDALEIDEHAWTRAHGWALSLEMIALPYYRARNPAATSDSPSFIAEILADFATEQ
jgi:aminoglycoside phosphotransferase (APT) family kinase protein